MRKGCLVNLFWWSQQTEPFHFFKASLFISANQIFIFCCSLDLWICASPGNLKPISQTKQAISCHAQRYQELKKNNLNFIQIYSGFRTCSKHFSQTKYSFRCNFKRYLLKPQKDNMFHLNPQRLFCGFYLYCRINTTSKSHTFMSSSST